MSKSPKKTSYRVSNWVENSNSLVQRGSVTVWIDDDVLESWRPVAQGWRKRGGQSKYSNRAIECLLTLKAMFHLAYRQWKGLARR